MSPTCVPQRGYPSEGPEFIIDRVIEETKCGYRAAKTQISRIRKQLRGPGPGKPKSKKSKSIEKKADREAKTSGELVSSKVLDSALKKINRGYSSSTIDLSNEEVFALASQGTRLEDIAQSCGLSPKQFRENYGTAFDRGSAAFRVVLSATTTNIAVGDKDTKMVTALRNYEFGQGAGASNHTTNILIASDRDSLIEKIRAAMSIDQGAVTLPVSDTSVVSEQ